MKNYSHNYSLCVSRSFVPLPVTDVNKHNSKEKLYESIDFHLFSKTHSPGE